MAKRQQPRHSPRFRSYIRRQPEPSKVGDKKDYVIYGPKDDFPLHLLKLVSESPSASSCISVVCDFIEGDGFGTEIGSLVVNNQGETLEYIHHLLSESLGTYEGMALNVKYSAEAKVTQIFYVPFENCRLGKPDSKGIISEIKYNPYFGTGMVDDSKTETYDTFNPDPAVVRSQMAKRGTSYKGQILYWGSVSALNRFYPMPTYYSAKNWMEVDYRISEYHKENLRNGFLQSAIFKLIGDPNAPSTNPNDTAFDAETQKQQPIKTQGEVFDEMMSENFSGTERVGNVMALWANNKEEFPTVEAFPTSVNAQLLDAIQNLTTKNITIATKVPAILANIHEGVSLGSDGNTMKMAVKIMQTRAQKWQKILEGVYDKVFKVWYQPIAEEIEITDHNPFPEETVIDPQVWDFLNPETKKKWVQDNTSIKWVDPAPTPAAPAPPPAGPSNAAYGHYPEKASANARKAMDWNDKQSTSCGTRMGWRLCDEIAERRALPYKTIKRLRNYLKRHEPYMNRPFAESCEAVLFYAWGGKEMLDWAEQKIKEQEE